MEKLPKISLPIIIVIVLVIVLITKSAFTIISGEAGVLYKLVSNGVVIDEPPLSEGFHFIAPWNKVFVYEVRQQELFEKITALSSKGLKIKIEA